MSINIIPLGKVRYALGALPKRLVQPCVCPSCGALVSTRADRKGFHELRRCGQCALLYRWPSESAAEMETFYQQHYKQAGLTTDLPDASALKLLLAKGFKGSSKDFSKVLAVFRAIGLPAGARILDFGANWGYGVWQFQQAGYEAMGYELSKPRAEFSKELGVQLLTDWCDVVQAGPFDVVFSSHVLEHTPDPAQALRDQLAVLKTNGFLIALFPNGSDAFRLAEPQAFHQLWGHVHPVMLNDRFISETLKTHIVFQGSLTDKDIAILDRWDQQNNACASCAASELLVVARCHIDKPTIASTV